MGKQTIYLAIRMATRDACNAKQEHNTLTKQGRSQDIFKNKLL